MDIRHKISGHPPLPFPDSLPRQALVLWGQISPVISRQPQTTPSDTPRQVLRRARLLIQWR